MTMNTMECIQTRRSIRQFKADSVSHETIETIISAAAMAPSWKNSQITRYIAIENSSARLTIADQYVNEHNAEIIRSAPLLIAVTYIKNRSGFERDGSFSTKKGDRWQMFDAGIATSTFCLAAHELGLGSVIMGIFDEEGITSFLQLPEDQELAALIAVGYPGINPNVPKKKTVTDLLTYL